MRFEAVQFDVESKDVSLRLVGDELWDELEIVTGWKTKGEGATDWDKHTKLVHVAPRGELCVQMPRNSPRPHRGTQGAFDIHWFVEGTVLVGEERRTIDRVYLEFEEDAFWRPVRFPDGSTRDVVPLSLNMWHGDDERRASLRGSLFLFFFGLVMIVLALVMALVAIPGFDPELLFAAGAGLVSGGYCLWLGVGGFVDVFRSRRRAKLFPEVTVSVESVVADGTLDDHLLVTFDLHSRGEVPENVKLLSAWMFEESWSDPDLERSTSYRPRLVRPLSRSTPGEAPMSVRIEIPEHSPSPFELEHHSGRAVLQHIVMIDNMFVWRAEQVMPVE